MAMGHIESALFCTAIDELTSIAGYKDTDALIAQYRSAADEEMLRNLYQPGNLVTFGTYVQTGENATPVSWKVLEVEGDYALLLAENVLAYRAIDSDTSKCSWVNSELRAWLNDEFYTTAFTQEDRKAIVKRTVFNGKSGYKLGNVVEEDTDDCVFILSFDEACRYFDTVEESEAWATEAAFAAITYGTADSWWTRTILGSTKGNAIIMPFVELSEGNIRYSYRKYDYVGTGVRPAVWVNIMEFMPE